jgi:hypothetical protein
VSISTVPASRVSTNALILLAFKRAGIVPIEARLSGANMVPKLEHGRQVLDLIMDSLATEGFVARTAGFYDLPMLGGEPYYSLPDDILDVHGDCMFVPSDNPDTKFTSGELVCKMIDQMTWSTLTTKGSVSTRPQLYCVFRHGATVNLRFWPVPSEAGGDAPADDAALRGRGRRAEERRPRALLVRLPRLADGLLPRRRQLDAARSDRLLAGVAESKKKQCVQFSGEHTASIQAVVDYQTPWSAVRCGALRL